MDHIEFVELIAMIIAIISLINFPFIIKRRRDFIKYLPGIFFLILVFVFENIEEIFLHEISAIIENIFLIIGATLLVTAVFIELKKTPSKKKLIHSSKK